MDETSNKGMYIAFGTILALVVITFAITIFNKNKPLQKTALSTQDTMIQSINSSSFSSYDNQIVTGDLVITAINTKASDDLKVLVKTNSNPAGKVYTSSAYNISDISDSNYIEPTASFKATLGKTSNGTVNLITFVQQ
ncbi:hypothetical protein [Clostridium oryzae]|uniref:Uncharacterized protein n=1 Tax=Clostridium oryzae TaxID=1450648 RepID=A0A1V4IIM7_9CLOT|nr:hypothetical protein [Clostridium oryzae]OPJ59769.1 hypothetical protein CLORY_31140 [Clostridium oryzae]